MAVEEITLHAVALPRRTKREEQPKNKGAEPEDLDPIVRDLVTAIRQRDRLVLTEKSRLRNQNRFTLALKSLVKAMATQGAARVRDRDSRVIIRNELYSSTMSLVQALADDQQTLLRRSRRLLKWGLASATIGVLGVLTTSVLNGWIQLPLG